MIYMCDCVCYGPRPGLPGRPAARSRGRGGRWALCVAVYVCVRACWEGGCCTVMDSRVPSCSCYQAHLLTRTHSHTHPQTHTRSGDSGGHCHQRQAPEGEGTHIHTQITQPLTTWKNKRQINRQRHTCANVRASLQVVTVTGTTTSGKALSEDALRKTEEGCAMALQLDEDKRMVCVMYVCVGGGCTRPRQVA